MPTYQYACTECSHAFEQTQSFSDDALAECPECAGRLRKLFGAVGVVFKGSGFYRNDSRSEGTRSGREGDAGSSEGSTESGSKEPGSKESGSKEPATAGAKASTEPATAGAKASGSGSKESASSGASSPATARSA